MDQTSNKKDKDAYETPKLIKVNLRPEEAVLGFCKTSTSSGPSSGSCMIIACSSTGS